MRKIKTGMITAAAAAMLCQGTVMAAPLDELNEILAAQSELKQESLLSETLGLKELQETIKENGIAVNWKGGLTDGTAEVLNLQDEIPEGIYAELGFQLDRNAKNWKAEAGFGTEAAEWDGNEWTEVSTLPYEFSSYSAVVFNDEIHILGGSTRNYKWDGNEWTKVSSLPYAFYYGSAVVFNDEIHILGGNNSRTTHYKWDGSKWTEVSTLPYEFRSGSAVVFNNEIHILGSAESGNVKKHYKLSESNGTTSLTFIADTSWYTTPYDSSTIFKDLNELKYPLLPEKLRKVLKPVNKLLAGSDGNNTNVACKLWIPSISELGSDLTTDGNAYDVFTDLSSRIRNNNDGNLVNYWTRSACNSSSEKQYYVDTTGNINEGARDTERDVIIGFCI